jgi:hypothetical protein
LHARRIPNVKAYYSKLENEMQTLVERQRHTADSVSRGQLSVAVVQRDVTGSQVDIEVNQTWDSAVGDAGRNLSNAFGHLLKCTRSAELRRRGATEQAIATWETACQQAMLERTKFDPVFRRVMDQRSQLKAFQTGAESRRRALVAEADRIQ